jgi:hypothetical protein
MSDYPPQYPDQNPASGWPPPAQPGPAVPEQRDQSSNPPADVPAADEPSPQAPTQPEQQMWYTEPPTMIAPANYPASPAYPSYPASPPADPYAASAAPTGYPADSYPTTPYPQPPAAVYPPVSSYPASPSYGQPMAYVVTQPPSSGVATASMVLGIVGLLLGWCSCGIPALLAIILGHMGLNQTRNNQKSGRGMAIAGLILGYVVIVPAIIATVFVAIALFGSATYSAYSP